MSSILGWKHDSRTQEHPLSSRIVSLNIDALRPDPGNPRHHTTAQITRIMRSIERFGFLNPPLVDKSHMVIAGHARLEAARELGMPTIPVVVIDHLTAAEVRAYNIADNRLAELAEWDEGKLAIVFESLIEMDMDFDLSITGFDMPEIDLVIQGQTLCDGEDAPDAADLIPLPENKPVVTRQGDTWDLNAHRITCGDARNAAVISEVMQGGLADMAFTDPPYNVPVNGHVSGKGAVRHDEFPMASGEMDAATFKTFLETSLGGLAQYSTPGAIHFVCMDWRHLSALLAAGEAVYGQFINLCVWCKSNGGMGSLYRSQHELILVFKVSGGAHVNNVRLGRYGRNRTNVWEYPGLNSFGAGRIDDLRLHPTVKPVAMVADAILDCSPRGGIVLDGFGGSGTTILAAERTGRYARVVELDPRYVDVSIRRWETVTGGTARLCSTGETYAETARTRMEAC